MMIDEYVEKVNGFWSCLEAQGWLSTFLCPESNFVMALKTEFYHTMEQPSLQFVQGRVKWSGYADFDKRNFRNSKCFK